MDVPWSKNEDFLKIYNDIFLSNDLKEIFDFNFKLPFFSLTDNIGYIQLKAWVKESSIDFLIATVELFILLERFEKTEFDKFNQKLSEVENSFLAHKLIQIVNLIIDGFKKKKKYSQNMYEIAQKINFPKYIIDLRHSATHGRTPDNISLFNGLLDSLKYLKISFWDKQYKVYTEEISLKSEILEYISTGGIVKLSENIEELNVKLDILSIKVIMQQLIDKEISNTTNIKRSLIDNVLSKCKYNKKEILSEFIYQGVERIIQANKVNTLNDVDKALSNTMDSILLFISKEEYDYYSLDIILIIKNFYFFLKFYNKNSKHLNEKVSLLYQKAISFDIDKIIEPHFNTSEDNIFINDYKLNQSLS